MMVRNAHMSCATLVAAITAIHTSLVKRHGQISASRRVEGCCLRATRRDSIGLREDGVVEFRTVACQSSGGLLERDPVRPSVALPVHDEKIHESEPIRAPASEAGRDRRLSPATRTVAPAVNHPRSTCVTHYCAKNRSLEDQLVSTTLENEAIASDRPHFRALPTVGKNVWSRRSRRHSASPPRSCSLSSARSENSSKLPRLRPRSVPFLS